MATPFINHNTTVANWLALVSEAQVHAGQVLAEELESYLVFLLQRYVACTKFADSVLALDFLHALNQRGNQREGELRDVGDKCLLFAGLFPEQAKRRRISLNYFTELGQSAYDILSAVLIAHPELAKLYCALCENFLDVRDTLGCIRQMARKESMLTNLRTDMTNNSAVIVATNFQLPKKLAH